MTLTDADKEKLQAALDMHRTRGPDDPSPASDRKPTTDTSIALVRHGGSKHSDRVYHAFADGEPACGTEAAQYFEWDKDRAREWMDPCRLCYPDGDDEVSDE